MTATASRMCAVSIDLDPVPCYYQIHGLGPSPAELAHVVMERAVPRFAALLRARGIRATFFVVGAEPDGDDGVRGQLAELHAGGHELANHSYSHPYEMARLPAARVADEIGRCDDVLRSITGAPIAGFRAPGYDVSPAMLAELARRGYRYDSSIFPAPGYYAAKAAVMVGLAVVGRSSGAVMTDPRALLAPADPYWPALDAPWRRGQGPVIELPIAVTPRLRLPAIGTTLLVAPPSIRKRIVAAMARRRLFNFELHGIDLADADEDGIPGELVARQPDLRIPVERKVDTIGEILDQIEGDGARFVTLAEAATWAHREA